MEKKIHVTGARGYLGSLLVNYLRAAGHQVEAAGYRLPDVPPKSIDADLVIHLAAAGGGTAHKPRPGHNDPEYMKKVNLDGMHALLAGIKKRDAKIIFISSTAVYGKFDDAPLVNEESPLQPVSLYGIHKMKAERILQKSEFDWMIFRPCSIFGPSVGYNFGNSFLIPAIENALKNKQVDVWGGDQLIDTFYIVDIISVLLQACGQNWHSGEIFNIGGEVVRVKEMLAVVSETLKNAGFDCPLVFKPFGGKPAAITDSSKLKSAFPEWKNTPLTQSIHALVTGFLLQF